MAHVLYAVCIFLNKYVWCIVTYWQLPGVDNYCEMIVVVTVVSALDASFTAIVMKYFSDVLQ